jgi:hypothetical protein
MSLRLGTHLSNAANWRIRYRRGTCFFMKVVFLAGTGRNGSTLLEGVLNEIPGIVSVGELNTVWNWDEMASAICTCGSPASECPFWSEVFRNVFAKLGITWTEARRASHSEGRFRNASSLRRRSQVQLVNTPFQELIKAIYEEVSAISGAEIIVDSSKSPTVLALLTAIRPPLDLSIIHLVRDPRANAFAWRKLIRDERMPSGEMLRFGIVRSTIGWYAINREVCKWGTKSRSYLVLRYEDLMLDPIGALGRVCELVGATASTLPFLTRTSVELTQRHVLMGNRIRGEVGRVDLKFDREWETSMSSGAQRFVGIATWPIRKTFGYG